MAVEHITLIHFGFFEKGILDKIFGDVEKVFHVPVKIRDGYLDLAEYYDPARRQYNGNLLLKTIDASFGTENTKTMGIFNVDLFIPILTFIYGQAFLNGKSGIASAYRLRNERYGLKPDENLLIERFKKEIIHELGHTFGLVHCQTPDCVMRSSTYVEDIDQKLGILCHHCREIIHPALKN